MNKNVKTVKKFIDANGKVFTFRELQSFVGTKHQAVFNALNAGFEYELYKNEELIMFVKINSIKAGVL